MTGREALSFTWTILLYDYHYMHHVPYDHDISSLKLSTGKLRIPPSRIQPSEEQYLYT
jgi:hypothetical protein